MKSDYYVFSKSTISDYCKEASMISISPSMQKINVIMVRIDEVYHEAALRLGLSDSSMWILYLLAQYGELTQAQISRMCGISKQTIHSSVLKLTGDGILEVQTSAKNMPLKVTAKGKTFINEKISKLIRAENAVMDSWSPEEQQQFIRFNQQYLERLAEQIQIL